MIKFKKISHKIFTYFLIVSLSPCIVWMYIQYRSTREELLQQAQNRLNALKETKRERLQNYFLNCRSEISYLAQSELIKTAAKELISSFHTITNADVSAEMWQSIENFYKQNLQKIQIYQTQSNELLAAIPTDFKTIYFQYYYKTNRKNAVDASRYKAVHDKYQAEFARLLDHFGYYDLYIIDNQTGYIVYSLTKEIDYATNLVKGNFQDTHLAQVWREIQQTHTREAVKMTDFQLYLPSFDAPAAFLAAPIYDENVKIATLVLQLSPDEINAVLTGNMEWQQQGMGLTGEVFLVGNDGTFRSDARLFLEHPQKFLETLRQQRLPETTIRTIQLHKTCIRLLPFAHDLLNDTVRLGVDYRGKSVLMSSTFLKIPDVDWVVVAQIHIDEIFSYLETLQKRWIIWIVALFAAMIGAIVLLAQNVTQPIRQLSEGVRAIAQGNFHISVPENDQHEIHNLAKAFNNMAKTLHAQHLEIENQREKLAKAHQHLKELLEETEKQKHYIEQIENQKKQIKATLRHIQQSIYYAQRVQQAILPQVAQIRKVLPSYFAFFQPRDVVGGDFYWFHHELHADGSQTTCIALADCTGHGVPGAFMSLIGHNLLNEIIVQHQTYQPNIILRKLHQELKILLQQHKTEHQDSIEIGICVLERGIFGSYRKISYAGAKMDLFYITENTLTQIKGDKYRIGANADSNEISFTQHELPIQKAHYFLATDGYIDQFGEEIPEKFNLLRFKELLLSITSETPDEQAFILQNTINDWKGNIKQTDDITVIGFSL
ncbi:MAG: SpoIIE family protein phosphatase [Cytophagales bacterium]|nr:SpoIIE family protein phosphatase [Cytophagales bacterium]MDW8384828.1 SpoIIE family protein phosphatase [Flammeovirgaceae bacterium]